MSFIPMLGTTEEMNRALKSSLVSVGWRSIGALILCGLLSACAPKHVHVEEGPEVTSGSGAGEQAHRFGQKHYFRQGTRDMGCKTRVITEKEILKLKEKDPELTRLACLDILARLNRKARYHIPGDIKRKKRLIVPNDFRAYKDWTPLPTYIKRMDKVPKFILVVKDIPFLGWYERGRMVGDSQTCIGKRWEWTKSGIYKVIQKDANHFSQSYPDTSGRPTPMPLALRIYERVWIHAGDVVAGYCSHGCINLPLEAAEEVFNWAQPGTLVCIIDSLDHFDAYLNKYARRFAF